MRQERRIFKDCATNREEKRDKKGISVPYLSLFFTSR